MDEFLRRSLHEERRGLRRMAQVEAARREAQLEWRGDGPANDVRELTLGGELDRGESGVSDEDNEPARSRGPSFEPEHEEQAPPATVGLAESDCPDDATTDRSEGLVQTLQTQVQQVDSGLVVHACAALCGPRAEARGCNGVLRWVVT
eukprot:scaffold96_cov302-Prasinococcus_capsulatus_cf.AAC.13